jgi:multiple sugar transport system ATP-binding protein
MRDALLQPMPSARASSRRRSRAERVASVALRGLCKDFGRTPVIKDIDLAIEDQEFAVFVGPSGCGKSTLLRLIAGLEDASAGEILIGGRVVNNMPPKNRNIAMVFQNYALYPHMTVARNMGFGLRAARLPAAEIDQRVRAAAVMLGLETLLDRRPGELSGGQRQRVAMGRAIVRAPQVFLFDEPLSNLDAQLRNQVRTEIKKLHQQVRTTAIYVTHDQVEAMTLADRIVLLREGRIEQVGAPMELFSQPANRFVASFIGAPAINLLPGRIEQGTIVLPWMRLPCPPVPAVPADGRVEVGVRPDDLLAGDNCLRLPPEYRFAVAVSVVEPMGSEALLIVNAGGIDVRVRLDGHNYPEAGTDMCLAIDPAQLHIFDATTGLALRR